MKLLLLLLTASGLCAIRHAAAAACSDSGSASALDNLPRLNRGFKSVDLTAMKPLVTYGSACGTSADPTTGGEDEMCLSPSLTGDDAMQSWMDGDFSDDPTEWWNYIDALAVYAAFGVTMALMVVICSGAFCCGRCCNLCGSKHPTKEGYSVREVAAARVLLGLFIVTTFSFMLVGEIAGNKALTSAQSSMVTSTPSAAVDLAQGAAVPLVTLLGSLVGTTLVGTVTRINATVTSVVDFHSVHESFGCIGAVVDLASPENLAFFSDALDDIESATDALPDQAATTALLEGLKNTTADAAPAAQAAQELIDDLDTTLAALDLALAPIAATVGDLRTGVVGTLKPELDAISATLTKITAPAVDGGPPSSADTQQLSTDTSTFAQSSTTPPPANGIELAGKYGAMADTLNAMPDPAALAISLVGLNDTMEAQAAAVTSASAELAACADATDAVPSVARMRATLTLLTDVLDGFKPAATKEAIAAIDGVLTALPNVAEFTAKIDELYVIQDKADCVSQLAVQLRAANESLIELPAAMNDVVDNQLATINQSAYDVTMELDGVKKLLADMNATLDQVQRDTNFTLYNQQIDDMTEATKDAKNSTASLQADLDALGAELTSNTTNVTALAQDCADLADELRTGEGRITPAQVSELNAVNESRTNATRLLLDGEILLNEWANYCLTQTQLLCDNAFALLRPELLKTASTLSSLQGSLDDLTIDTVADGVTDGLDRIADATASLDEVDEAEIADMRTTVQDTRIDAIGEKASVDELASSVADLDTELNLDELISSWADVGDALPSTEELAEYRQAFADANQTVQDATSDEITDLIEMEERLYRLLFTDLDGLLAPLSAAQFDPFLEARGFRSALYRVADQLDAILSAVNGTEQSGVRGKIDDSGLDGIFAAVDMLHPPEEGASTAPPTEGSLHYLMTLMATVGNETLPAASSAFADFDKPTVFGYVAGDGALYSYDERAGEPSACYTQTCLDNTVSYINEDTGLAASVIGVPISRQLAMGLPFLVPGILVMVALCACAKPSMALPLSYCTCCSLPLLFVLVAALLWPLLLASNDMCAVVEPAMVSGTTEIAPYLCDTLLGGEEAPLGGALGGACTFAVDWKNMSTLKPSNVPDPESTTDDVTVLTVSIPAIVESLVHSCAGKNPVASEAEAEAIAAIFKALQDDAASIASGNVDAVVDTLLDGLGVKPALRSDLDWASEALGGNVDELVGGLSTSFGCEALSSVYTGTKDPLCCEAVDALYWFVASWYLIGFSMLFCAIPGGILAHKRLRTAEYIGNWRERAILGGSHKRLESNLNESVGLDGGAGLYSMPMDGSATSGAAGAGLEVELVSQVELVAPARNAQLVEGQFQATDVDEIEFEIVKGDPNDVPMAETVPMVKPVDGHHESLSGML